MLSHRRIVLLSLLSLATALLVGCATAQPAAPPATGGEETPQYGGVLINHPSNADPPSFDSQLENTYNLNRPIAATHSSLVRFSPTEANKLVSDLAEKWDASADGKTMTFTLRKGVQFHSGNEFTSADVKFNIERLKGQITNGPGALPSPPRKDLVRAINKVETPDPYTAVFRMDYPSASLMGFLATVFAPMYDKKWLEAGHDPKKEFNGAGPFKLKEYIRGTSYELVKNENYWEKGRPYLDGVKTYIIPDLGTVVASMRSAQIMFMSLTQAQYEALQAQVDGGELKGKIDLVKIPSTSGGTSVWINVTKPPFNDQKVRTALTLAVDRKEVAKVQGGPDSVVKGWMPAGTFFALPPEELAKMPGYGADKAAERAEAKRLLAEAGYPNGLALKGINRNEQSYIDNAIIYSDQFTKVGITLDTKLMIMASAYDLMEKKEYEISFSSGGSGTTEDPDTVFGQFHVCGSPRNYIGMCDPKVEDLFTRQSQALDPQVRQKLSWELEKLVLTMVGGLPGAASTPGKWAVNTQVRGFQPGGDNQYRFDQVWLAK